MRFAYISTAERMRAAQLNVAVRMREVHWLLVRHASAKQPIVI
jgi:hypothetical protein